MKPLLPRLKISRMIGDTRRDDLEVEVLSVNFNTGKMHVRSVEPVVMYGTYKNVWHRVISAKPFF